MNDHEETLEHFRVHGWMRVRGAFSVDEAAAMRAAAWRALAQAGIVWSVPSHGWHADANYLSALSPPAGVRTHALFGDVAVRAGGTLIVSGSHRLVHQYFKDNPPPPGTRGAAYRQLLQGHPYIRALHTEGDIDERAVRFIGRAEAHGGISLQVVDNTGAAGDVILLHPLVLHVATPNTSKTPRFLLSGGVDLPPMWAA